MKKKIKFNLNLLYILNFFQNSDGILNREELTTGIKKMYPQVTEN